MLNLNTTAAQVPQEVARLDATTQRQLNANAAVLVRGLRQDLEMTTGRENGLTLSIGDLRE